jgi:hypothetical protein
MVRALCTSYRQQTTDSKQLGLGVESLANQSKVAIVGTCTSEIDHSDAELIQNKPRS